MVQTRYILVGLLILLSGFTAQLCAQDSDTNTYCVPGVVGESPGKGVVLQYEAMPEPSVRGEDGTRQNLSSIQRAVAKIRIPLMNKLDKKALLGLRYDKQEYHFSPSTDTSLLPAGLSDRDMKSFGLALYGIKSLNYKHYLATRFLASLNGDYSGLKANSIAFSRFSLALIFGVKRTSHFEYGFGAIIGLWDQSFSALPIALVNYTRDRWGIKALLPSEAYFRYSFAPYHIGYAGAEYHGSKYMLDEGLHSKINSFSTYEHSAFRYGGKWESRLMKYVWLGLHTGYEISWKLDLEPRNEPPLFNGNANPNFYLGIDVSLRPE